jgi:IclR family transcriptional regulator, pca regulon regulatory protein
MTILSALDEGSNARSRTPVASLVKGLLVLETLALIETKGSVTELMERTGLDRAAVNRMLRSLMDAGYIERRSRGEYGVSARAHLLGVHLTQAHHLVRIAQPELRLLSAEIKETVNLAILDGSEVVYLERLAVGRILSFKIEIGTRLPAFSASLGRAILAFLPESEALGILRQAERPAFTPNTKTSIEDLAAVLSQTRRRGYALTNQEFELGLCSMAFPIFERGGRPVAAVNVAVLAARLSATELARRYRKPLQHTCEQISRALGWEGATRPTSGQQNRYGVGRR